MREVLLVLHILGAALWIGGGVVTVLARRPLVGGDRSISIVWMGLEEKLGKAYFPATAILTLLTGIGLVILADEYDFLDLFVLIGIAAFLLSAIGNSAYVGRVDARAVEAWKEGNDQSASSLVTGTTRFHILDNAVLILALVAMVYRWGS